MADTAPAIDVPADQIAPTDGAPEEDDATSPPMEDQTDTSISKTEPPAVITLDTTVAGDSASRSDGEPGSSEKGFVQAQTPKHANKTADQKVTPDRGEKAGGFHPPRPYEGRPLGGSGAFQPHEPRRQPTLPSEYFGRPPMQVSPGGGDYSRRYYPERGGPPRYPSHGHPNAGYYDQRGYSEYPPRQGYEGPPGGPPPPGYRVQQPPYSPQQSYSGYLPDGRSNGPPWNSHPHGYPPAQRGNFPPQEQYPRGGPPVHDGRYVEQPGGHEAVSRAVSSSFDRSVKSRSEEKMAGMTPSKHDSNDRPPKEDASIGSDDLSWKQLKQVHSVDDSAIRDRINEAKKEDTESEDNHPPSNSSSLTNSPTEGPEKLHAAQAAKRVVEAAAAKAEAGAQPSSLDSLASVTSELVSVERKKSQVPASPGTDASLDLMKCSSGSSGLLHLPAHQRSASADAMIFDGKRARDEERGDDPEAERAGDDIRRAPSGFDDKPADAAPPGKRARVEDKRDADAKFKASPGSITFSPSAKEGSSGRKLRSKADYHKSPQAADGSFYDKPPQYSYSLDSAPTFPKDQGSKKQSSYPSLPPRPGSSASSTITPGAMQIDNRDGPDGNAQLPSVQSWEIQAQDSFGNGSVGGGNGLSSSFSFQDYPMLAGNDSNLGGNGDTGQPVAPGGPPPVQQQQHPHHPPVESRNQSFEGHYQQHGAPTFHRNDSMDGGYGPRHGYNDRGHMGQFPPHAPSWGTAGSSGSHYQGQPAPPYYGGGRDYHQGGVMRNYSHDSGHRTSPPPGPPGHPRMHPGQRGGFQPPPEFAAPHNPHLSRRPPPNVYIMATSHGMPVKGGNGAFSWSKADDMRLTEIMKKYKNPRDWEPVAKEHNMGRTAKECHERWIRYLKPGVRKGQWTDHEDAIVIDAVTNCSEQPFTRWSDLAQRLPGRVGKQIRDRWVNHLNPNINHLPFSRDDDLLLWDGHKKLGKRWVEISTKFFNSTRSENHIKNRWYSASFKKFIANEFGPDAYSGTKKKGDDKSKKKKMKDEDPATQSVV